MSTIICERRAASSWPMVIKATQNYTSLMRVGTAASVRLLAGHIGGVTFMTSGLRTNPGIAREALDRIGALYDIERDIAGRPADVRLATRQKHSKPKVEELHASAEKQLLRIPGKSELAKALRYGLSRWPSLSLFLEDGRVAMDNNTAERALRPIGVGRRNWLFAGADTGAETLVRAMMIIETAKMSGPNPQACLADVLDRIHDHKINRLDEFLPWNWKPLVAEHAKAA